MVVDASVLVSALLLNGAARARLAETNLQAPDLIDAELLLVLRRLVLADQLPEQHALQPLATLQQLGAAAPFQSPALASGLGAAHQPHRLRRALRRPGRATRRHPAHRRQPRCAGTRAALQRGGPGPKSVHPELAFQKEDCEVLGSHGWLYDDGAAAHYDRKLALYPPDLIAWLQEPQADAWATYQQKNGSTAEANPLQRVREQLDQQGTLDLLCNGIEVMQLFSGVGSSKPRTAVDMRQLRERSSARNRRARGNSTGSGSNRLRSLDKR